jgi:hypothetical protein
MAAPNNEPQNPIARPKPPPQNKPTWLSIGKALVAGGLAGGISRTCVAPLERLKILMQVQGNDRVYRNTWQVRCGRGVLWRRICLNTLTGCTAGSVGRIFLPLLLGAHTHTHSHAHTPFTLTGSDAHGSDGGH